MGDINPITRKEIFLAKAGGQSVTPPEPITREEHFLNDIVNVVNGEEPTAGEPITRKEMFLRNNVGVCKCNGINIWFVGKHNV